MKSTAPRQGLAIVLYDPRLVTDDPNNGISGLQMRLHLSLMRSDMFKEATILGSSRPRCTAARSTNGRTLSHAAS